MTGKGRDGMAKRAGYGILWAVAAVAACGAETGAVSGKVVDEKDKGVAGALVTLTMAPVSFEAPVRAGTGLPEGPSRGAAVKAQVRTSADGGFAFTHLPDGGYRVCAEAAEKQLIRPCAWDAKPFAATVIVTEGKAVALAPIVLERAIAVKVMLLDEAGVLRQNEGKAAGAAVVAGVWVGSLFQPCVFAEQQEGKARECEMRVAAGRDFEVAVFSTYFVLADGEGARLEKGWRKRMRVEKGETPEAVQVVVSGVERKAP
jgi:hypothetical protein